MAPSLITYLAADGSQRILASDEGILVKCGHEVLIATLSAIPGKDLDTLREVVAANFQNKNKEERQALSAVARLETGIVRRFIEMEKLP